MKVYSFIELKNLHDFGQKPVETKFNFIGSRS